MNKFSITFTFLLCMFGAKNMVGQSQLDTVKVKADVQNTVQKLFDAMRNNDSATLHTIFTTNARLLSVASEKGNIKVFETPIADFIDAVGQPKKEVWNEVIWSYSIELNNEIASVWCPYSFFLEQNGHKQLLHCGVNSIELYLSNSGWQITQITDTREETGCREN